MPLLSEAFVKKAIRLHRAMQANSEGYPKTAMQTGRRGCFAIRRRGAEVFQKALFGAGLVEHRLQNLTGRHVQVTEQADRAVSAILELQLLPAFELSSLIARSVKCSS